MGRIGFPFRQSSNFPMNHPLTPEFYTAEEVVALLQLEPLDQEGGYFRRTMESELVLPAAALPPSLPGGRRAYSVIYALLTPRDFSALHRLATDEIWCFHAGDTLESLRLAPGGRGEWVRLGTDLTAGERLQDVVPAQFWQGTRLAAGGRWALFSTVMAPEFTWADFELGERAVLTAKYPEFTAGIAALTRPQPARGVK
jgi:hypothetical protein